MNIRFSRHAKHRQKLYDISRSDILQILALDHAEEQPLNNRRELISEVFVAKYGWPIFVSYVREPKGITVVTNFPYDRETNYEDILR
ncbi:MAG TPA: hypothetical protein VGM92_04140 [Candidatus Kapabacteria bacterium]